MFVVSQSSIRDFQEQILENGTLDLLDNEVYMRLKRNVHPIFDTDEEVTRMVSGETIVKAISQEVAIHQFCYELTCRHTYTLRIHLLLHILILHQSKETKGTEGKLQKYTFHASKRRRIL